jgi:16S rRNA (guanine(527)-N(7))-methyltransferase RsmG
LSSFSEDLAAEFAPYGILSEEQLKRLKEHYEMLLRWNERMNLTRIESVEDAVRFHYGESLFLAKSLPPEPLRIVDVGSGAGFPGIPVAVFRPDCTVDLVESHQRKAVFLRRASSDLGNVKVLAQRAEVCQRDYDWMVARAVRADQVLSYRLAPRAGILMSGGDANGSEGVMRIQHVPWGENRVLVEFHVEHDKEEC